MLQKVSHSLGMIEEACGKYKNIAVACSFGKDSVVTVHLCRRIKPDIQVIFIKTPYKFRETINYANYLTDLWNLNLKIYEAPILEPELYKKSISDCCKYYKVDVLKRAIGELKLDCWISGMRATEGETRRNVPKIQEDSGLIKINPILDFTEGDIYDYHDCYRIPFNPLYFKGYRSLGCEPCTKPGGRYERDGRWANTPNQGKECQIHTIGLRSGKQII